MDPHVVTERVQAAAAAIAVGRLVYVGLAKRFPAVLAWLILEAISNFAYSILSPRSQAYFYTYFAVTPLDCILSILAVRELVNLIFTNYPGIRTVGRWAIYAGIVVAIVVSSALTISWTNTYHHKKWGLYYLESAQRSIVFSLVVVILAILFALSKYPLRLGRNTWVTSAFFSTLFLSEAAVLLFDSLAPNFYNHVADTTESFFIAACVGIWAFLLQPHSVPVSRVAFASPQEEHLLRQLDALNQLMNRAARR
jgi:hypothetical protein